MVGSFGETVCLHFINGEIHNPTLSYFKTKPSSYSQLIKRNIFSKFSFYIPFLFLIGVHNRLTSFLIHVISINNTTNFSNNPIRYQYVINVSTSYYSRRLLYRNVITPNSNTINDKYYLLYVKHLLYHLHKALRSMYTYLRRILRNYV